MKNCQWHKTRPKRKNAHEFLIHFLFFSDVLMKTSPSMLSLAHARSRSHMFVHAGLRSRCHSLELLARVHLLPRSVCACERGACARASEADHQKLKHDVIDDGKKMNRADQQVRGFSIFNLSHRDDVKDQVFFRFVSSWGAKNLMAQSLGCFGIG